MNRPKLNTRQDLEVVYEAEHPLSEAQRASQQLEEKILDDYLRGFERDAAARLRARHRSRAKRARVAAFRILPGRPTESDHETAARKVRDTEARELAAELALLRNEVRSAVRTHKRAAAVAGRPRAQRLLVATDRMRRFRHDSPESISRPGAEARIARCLARYSDEMVELLRQEKATMTKSGAAHDKIHTRAPPRREKALRLTQTLLHAESVLNSWSIGWEKRQHADEPHPSSQHVGAAAVAHATKQRAEWLREDDHQRALATVQLAGAERAAADAEDAATEAEKKLMEILADVESEDWLRDEAKTEATRLRAAAAAVRQEAVDLVRVLEQQGQERRNHGAGAMTDLEAVWTMDAAELDAAVFEATAKDDIQILRRVIDAGADMTVTNEAGQTALQLAVERHKFRPMLLLLEPDCTGIVTSLNLARLGPALNKPIPPVGQLEKAVSQMCTDAGAKPGFGLDLQDFRAYDRLRTVGNLLVEHISTEDFQWIDRYVTQLEAGAPLISEAEEQQMRVEAEAAIKAAKAKIRAEQDARLEAEARQTRLAKEEAAALARKKEAKEASAVAALAREMEEARLRKLAEEEADAEKAELERQAAERRAEAEAQRQRKAEEWERKKKEGQAMAARLKAEAEEAARLKIEEEKARQDEEQEKARLKEELARLKAEQDAEDRRLQREKEHAAAAKIQKLQRGKRDRQKYELHKAKLQEDMAVAAALTAKRQAEQDSAAVKIQSVYRGRRCRLQRLQIEEDARRAAAAAAAAERRAQEDEAARIFREQVAAQKRAEEEEAAEAKRRLDDVAAETAWLQAQEDARAEQAALNADLATDVIPLEQDAETAETELQPCAAPDPEEESNELIPMTLRRYTLSRTGDKDWLLLWYFLEDVRKDGRTNGQQKWPSQQLLFKRRHWGAADDEWRPWTVKNLHPETENAGTVRCAGGWWHSPPIDLLEGSASVVSDRPRTPSGGHPTGTAQIVALPLEYSVWVNGRLQGKFGADPSAVVLDFPPLMHRPPSTMVAISEEIPPSEMKSADATKFVPTAESPVRRRSLCSSDSTGTATHPRRKSQSTPHGADATVQMGDCSGGKRSETPEEGGRRLKAELRAAEKHRIKEELVRIKKTEEEAEMVRLKAAQTPRTNMMEEALELLDAEQWAEAERKFLQVAEEDDSKSDLCIYNVAVIQERLGNVDEAREVYAQVEMRRLARLGEETADGDQLLLRARMGLVNVLDHLGDHAEAEKLCRETHAKQCAAEQLGPDHPDSLRSLSNLAGLVGERGDSESVTEAKAMAENVYDRQVTVLGADHPDVIISQHNKWRLAVLHNAEQRRRRRSSGALSNAYQESKSSRPRRLSARPPTGGTDDLDSTLLTPRQVMFADASRLQADGHLEEAEKAFLDLAEHPDVDQYQADICLYNVAVMAEQRGDYEHADEVYGVVEARRVQSLGPGAPPDQLLLRIRMGIVNLLDEQGHLDAAEQLCQNVFEQQKEHLGKDHPDTLRTEMNLAGFAQERGDLTAAKSTIKDVQARQAASLGSDHPDVLLSKYNLGSMHADAGDFAEAAALVQEVTEHQALALGMAHPSVIRMKIGLSDLLGTGEFVVIAPPASRTAPLGKLEVTVEMAEKLRPTRRKIKATRGRQRYAVMPAGGGRMGDEEAVVATEHVRPYLLVCCGNSGLAGRTSTGTVGIDRGRPTWVTDKHDRGLSSALTFELSHLPAFLRLYCFDELDPRCGNEIDDSETGQSLQMQNILARRCDVDAFVGAGAYMLDDRFDFDPFEEQLDIDLHFPVRGTVWDSDLLTYADETKVAGRIRISVQWVPPERA
eukprot:SAG31_NODE_1783_length_7280_cov_105.645314_4_plen_1810_part_00